MPKMRTFFLSFALLFSGATVYAVSSVGSITFGTDTQQIVVSSTPAKPTQLMAATSFVSRTIIVNPTAYNLFISTVNITISTNAATGAPFFVPPFSSFSPDGPQDAYDGAMYGVLGSTASAGSSTATQSAIGVFRAK